MYKHDLLPRGVALKAGGFKRNWPAALSATCAYGFKRNMRLKPPALSSYFYVHDLLPHGVALEAGGFQAQHALEAVGFKLNMRLKPPALSV